jgi:methionyl-tRNA formyltransferase
MRLVILTQDAPIYLAPFLDNLFTRLAQTEHEVVAVVSLPPFFKKSRLKEIRERYQFYGTVAFVQMVGYILLNKIRSWLGQPTSVTRVLQKHHIPRHEVSNVNQPVFLDWLRENQIELVVSVAFPKILKQPLLSAPPKGCINYHTALLPRYRGRMPLFWALLNGESEVGITVHEMDEGIDSGAIITQERLPVDPADSLHDLYIKTTQRGVGVLLKAIEMLAAGDPARLVNDPAQATYFTFPTPDEAYRFRRIGKRFF